MARQYQAKDSWSSTEYQHSAAFVPKLATKVVSWLDVQKDDVILDIGCGDGILNFEFAKILAQGTGSIHGIDSSVSMIQSAKELCRGVPTATFEVLDATELSSASTLQKGAFTKAFSNAALHWILRDPATRQPVLDAVAASLRPGGIFALEMGGLGNVSEMRTALLLAVSRRAGANGLAAALAADPWFFPDEAWMRGALERAGFHVERVEREWRPTAAGESGVEGWVRLFGKQFLDVIEDENLREEAVKEVAGVLNFVCDNPAGGQMISYVRLRALATKL